MSKFFSGEQHLFQHLIDGGMIRPYFKGDREDKRNWIHLVDGNRVYVESGKRADNALIGLNFWIAVEEG